MSARLLEEIEGSHHVGLDEVIRPVDRSIDVTLRGEVDNGRRSMRSEEPSDQIAIRDVATDEYVARIRAQRWQVVQIACVGELV